MAKEQVVEMTGQSPTDEGHTSMQALEVAFGDRVKQQAALARYTAARIGGPADVLLEVDSANELAKAVSLLWRLDEPFMVLGGGSNVLIADAGVRGIVLINRARRVRFDELGPLPTVWAESGANFGLVARQAAKRGLGGLAWAAGIPGTVGGAVVGNAGAHGGDVAGNLLLAEILHRTRVPRNGELAWEAVRSQWAQEKFEFSYRSSALKRSQKNEKGQPSAVVLAALFRLEWSSADKVQARINQWVEFRRRTQPPGASMGSMFKNPPGDFAGRLIEAAGLKGASVGDAEISSLHANFFINRGQSQAAHVYELIRMAQKQVKEKFDVDLKLEIELVGEWDVSD
jgi:UDP-N-acetylmuramate dehydrogenase